MTDCKSLTRKEEVKNDGVEKAENTAQQTPEVMEKGAQTERKYELIVSIINRGYSELVMDSAKAMGATGGTIIGAKGTVAEKAKTILGISVQADKEMILILADKEKRNGIMSAIVSSAGLNTLGKGIVFSLPVDDVLGVALGVNNK